MIKETLCWSDYRVRVEIPSKINPAATVTVEAGFVCPKCRKGVKSTINHGHPYTHSCGLKMTVWGNALECEMPEPSLTERLLDKMLSKLKFGTAKTRLTENESTEKPEAEWPTELEEK